MWRHCHVTEVNRYDAVVECLKSEHSLLQIMLKSSGWVRCSTYNPQWLICCSIFGWVWFCGELAPHIWFSWPLSGRDLTLHIGGSSYWQIDILLQILQQNHQLANFGDYSQKLMWGYCSKDSNWKHEMNVWVRQTRPISKCLKIESFCGAKFLNFKMCDFILDGRWFYLHSLENSLISVSVQYIMFKRQRR